MSIFFRASCLALVVPSFLLFLSCASPKAPTGGVADTLPPVIIEAESTPNRQTNFKESEIVIMFDEWVTLKDVYNQLVISPPMPDEPEIRQKGKAVIIELPDSLREETTYTINFGNAIADLNEGNILENYVYVFSTGSVLDSNNLSGTVVDAVTLKAAEGVWVMLYKTGEDSAVYKRKPDYISKSNKTGQWSIGFLPVDSFDVIALKDENVNFLYDQEGEMFGWLPQPVYTGDLLNVVPPIYVFPRENRVFVKEVFHTAPGWMKLVIEAPMPKPLPVYLPALDSTVTFWSGDTLHVLYSPQSNYSGYAILEGDSTQIRISSQPSLLNQSVSIRAVSGRLRPGGKAVFQANIPLVSIDTSRIILEHDSLGIIPFIVERDINNVRRFSISAPWEGETRYPLLFLPGAVTDFWGRVNDTVRQSVVVTGADQFGDLTLTVDGLDSSKQYVILLREGEQIVDTFVVEDLAYYQIVKNGIPPGKYVIEIIEDINRNGVWDTGSYERRRQPERKMFFTPDNLRAGWEQEVKMSWISNKQ